MAGIPRNYTPQTTAHVSLPLAVQARQATMDRLDGVNVQRILVALKLEQAVEVTKPGSGKRVFRAYLPNHLDPVILGELRDLGYDLGGFGQTDPYGTAVEF